MKQHFGKIGRDAITGFTGRITGRTEYISGCVQILLSPPADKDGKLVDANWFDEQRIEVQEGSQIVLNNQATPGCDIPAPVR